MRSGGLWTALVVLVAGAGVLIWTGRSSGDHASASRSTLRATFADRDGNGTLEHAPGEPLADRTELAPAAREGRTIALLAQITDAHVRDEESPARPTFLDRLGPPLTSTFRPQEAASTQTLDAAVRSVNGLRPDAVLETGDLVDNAQADEMDQATSVLRGGRVRPDTGSPGYDGPQAVGRSDPFVYRPTLDAPRHPGLLSGAQRSFRSPGLRAPWYALPGNHDLLVQGEALPSARLQALATGARALVEPDPDFRPPRGARELGSRALDRVLARGIPGRRTAVARDPGRRLLSSPEVADRLRRASGHGGRGSLMDYAFSVGPGLRVIALDAVNRSGGSRGFVSPAQVGWLHDQLAAAGDRWVIVMTHRPLPTTRGGDPALAELDRFPRVVAAVSGDTHTNSVKPRRSAAGGYWLIGTSSLTDYPQQVRALRLVQTSDGGVALDTWMLDTAPTRLADTARDLAFLDAQGGRPNGDAGARLDRNVRLFRGAPRIAR